MFFNAREEKRGFDCVLLQLKQLYTTIIKQILHSGVSLLSSYFVSKAGFNLLASGNHLKDFFVCFFFKYKSYCALNHN